jgi:hypothetical protein
VNPNSQNQRWSLWEYRVYPDALHRPDYESVKTNAARFGRLAFTSAASMRIRQATDDRGRMYWEIAALAEGLPVHDPAYTEWMHEHWRKFLKHGFGEKSEILCHARLEAGDRQDGTPADQLIILPALSLGVKH